MGEWIILTETLQAFTVHNFSWDGYWKLELCGGKIRLMLHCDLLQKIAYYSMKQKTTKDDTQFEARAVLQGKQDV